MSQGANCQWANIGLGNGLVPIWHQAITWTNDDTYHWYIYTSLGLNLLLWFTICKWFFNVKFRNDF